MTEEVIAQEEIKKSETKARIIQIVFLILLLAAIVGIVFATLSIYKYRDMLENPLGYSLQHFGIDSCSCRDSGGKIIMFNATGSNNTQVKIVGG